MIKYIFPNKLKEKEPIPKKEFRVKWRNTDLASLEIIQEGAKKRVDDTIKDHHEISKKLFSLLVFISSISSALIVFLFGDNSSIVLNSITIAALLLCLLIILIIAQMIRPIKFRAPGREPYKAINPKLFENNKYDKNDLPKIIIYQELINSQATIELNQYYNSNRLNAIDFIIRVMLIGFISLVIILALTITI